MLFQILLDGAEPRDAGTTYSCLLQSAGEEAIRILLASALSSMRIICSNQGLKWDGMGRYGIPLSQSLSHDNTVCERRKERLGNVPFCIWLEV